MASSLLMLEMLEEDDFENFWQDKELTKTTMAEKFTIQNSVGKTDAEFDNDSCDGDVSPPVQLMIDHLTSRKRKGSSTSVVSSDDTSGREGHDQNESRPNYGNSTQNVVSTCSSSHTRIPNRTSKWTSSIIRNLRIFLDSDAVYPPLRILQDHGCEKPEMKTLLVWLKDIMIRRKYVTTYRVLEKKVQKIMECFKFYRPLKRINLGHIEQIKEHLTDIFQENMTTGDMDVTSKLPFLEPADQFDKYWNHVANMFNSKAGDFTADLKYMMSLQENGQNIPDFMYSTLFSDFIGMFGLRGVSFPSIPAPTIYIKGEEVKSTPDIVLMDRLNIDKNTHDAFSIKMLAVVKVKKMSQESKNPTPAKRRKETVSKTDMEVRIDDKVIGQHCGDLLLLRSMSASDEGIMGIIVEGTQVTFTYFLCNKEQLSAIESENYEYHGVSPSVFFSKSYNYLKASDRDELMETLLILGALQYSP